MIDRDKLFELINDVVIDAKTGTPDNLVDEILALEKKPDWEGEQDVIKELYVPTIVLPEEFWKKRIKIQIWEEK